MVTPTVRIPARAVPASALLASGDRICMRIRLRNEVGTDVTVVSGLAGHFDMLRVGEYFEVAGIFNPLDDGLDGNQLVLGVEVSGHGLRGERTVHVWLAP
jgi:hypothetical protein